MLQRIKQSSYKQTSDKKKASLRLSRSAEHQKWLAGITDNFRFQENFAVPDDIDEQVEITKRDLEEVPVLSRDQKVANARVTLDSEPDLDEEDKKLIWISLTVVRLNFQRLDRSAINPKRARFQWEMNWKHTRAEVNQVCEASRLLGLSSREKRDAVVASVFSDAIKNRSNFLIHNIHGAQAAACSLSSFLPFNEDGIQSMHRITRAIKEHQVAPPEFMSEVVAAHIAFARGFALKRLSEWDDDTSPVTKEQADTICAIKSIRHKIANPFDKSHLSKDLQTIDFTEQERQLLKEVGIEEWYVPHPENDISKVSHAVIAGDHCINYNHPEGFAKIALLRGPDCDPLFQDDTIHTSLASAVASFSDSYSILRSEIQPMAINGLRRTKRSVERVTAMMRELFSGITYAGEETQRKSGHKIVEQSVQRAEEKHPQLFDQRLDNICGTSKDYRRNALKRVGDILQDWYDAEGELPFEASGVNAPGDMRLPYWNSPLKYPPRLANGQSDESCLSPVERKQFAFAQRIREIAVELLRAEEWVF